MEGKSVSRSGGCDEYPASEPPGSGMSISGESLEEMACVCSALSDGCSHIPPQLHPCLQGLGRKVLTLIGFIGVSLSQISDHFLLEKCNSSRVGSAKDSELLPEEFQER